MNPNLKKSQETEKEDKKVSDKDFKMLSYLAWYIDLTIKTMIAIVIVFILIFLFFPKSSTVVKMVFFILLSPFISFLLGKLKIGVPLINWIYSKLEQKIK
jgi:ABC-type transport system involved in cytochrome bd biosynthesis fused ATPase/permease subunit